ncbi:ribonuclease P protein component [Algoriphagus sp.]|uniref:ribonuclease P protein component n=1 Tax=Algoriphagus sp. TaxID=1872435 RepID=UPI002623570D|nr:ribonuclease P protein component [Algoriphagus sp.]
MNYRFPKNERLHAQKLIKELFNEGSSFFLYPFKVLYLEKNTLDCHQVLISISKKKIKKAVHRNQLKRKIKESYRLNKHSLQSEERLALIGLIYVGSGLMDFRELEDKIKLILMKLQTVLSPKNETNEDKKK